ncbi:MAG: (Fe-S)-binding protein, partial [Dehalococcoidia bacterium]
MGSPIRDPFGIDGVCPVYHEKRFDHYTARGRMQIVWGLLDGFFDYSPALAEHAYTCCGCSACTAVCWADAEKRGEEGIKTARIMRAMRQDVVDMGLGPPEPLKA